MLIKKNSNGHQLTWVNFLHLYQPANADGHVIEEATRMSYERLVRDLEENPGIKFTWNIAGCLLLRWKELKYFALIKRIKTLVRRGQVELTGSAAYHPILPLIPEKEVLAQIKEQEDILRYYLGKNLKLKGFFLPEMAYGPALAKIIKKFGYEWILLDEIAAAGKLNQVDFNQGYEDRVSGLKIVFRSRKFSKCYVPDFLNKEIKKKFFFHPYITATDAELYGLRHNDPTAELEKLLRRKKLRTITVSELISGWQMTAKLKPLASSWESTEKDLHNHQPYALWYDRDNKVQMELWRLARMIYKTVENYKQDNNYGWARWHLVRGLASCTFWWASAKDFRLFGPISWSPDEIERGSNELIRAVRALDDVTTRRTKIKAERLYIQIKQLVWERHWKYYWKK